MPGLCIFGDLAEEDGAGLGAEQPIGSWSLTSCCQPSRVTSGLSTKRVFRKARLFQHVTIIKQYFPFFNIRAFAKLSFWSMKIIDSI